MPLKKSWVTSANSADHPFPLNNLPYGVFSTTAVSYTHLTLPTNREV